MVRTNFLKAHYLMAAMAQDRVPSRCSHVRDPIGELTEHCNEIAFALVVHHHQRERNETASAAAADFECDQAARPYPGRRDDGRYNAATRFGRPPLYIHRNDKHLPFRGLLGVNVYALYILLGFRRLRQRSRSRRRS